MKRVSGLYYVIAAFGALWTSGVASAQNLTIVSGNGQVTCASCTSFLFDPLVVRVTDAVGRPVPAAQVTWSVVQTTGGSPSIDGQVTVIKPTDANGLSSVDFRQQPPFFSQFGFTPYFQSQVYASIASATVVFTETTGGTNQFGVSAIGAALVSPEFGVSLSGTAGQQASVPIVVQVAAAGMPVAGIEVRLVPTPAVPVNPGDPIVLRDFNPITEPSVSCAPIAGQAANIVKPGTVLTEATGVATCNVIFGPVIGRAQFVVSVGGRFGFFSNRPIDFSVAPGVPGAILTACPAALPACGASGNNQSANPGAALALPLVALVTDAAGVPLGGVNITWTVTPAGAASVNPASGQSNAQGLVQTAVTLSPSAAGQVQVRAQVANNPAINATFIVNSNVVISGLLKAGGDAQEAAMNTAFASPLVIRVTSSTGAVANLPVSFTVTGGSVTLGTPNVVTNAAGQAATTVQAGPTAGPVVVTATAGGFTAIFNLTVRPPGPVFTAANFFNAAGFQRGSISPCSIATITGTGFATGMQGTVTPGLFGPLPVQLANVRVQFGNMFAPIFHVSNLAGQEQVTVQVPCEILPGSVPVTMFVGNSSTTVQVAVQPVSPGIFDTLLDGRRRAVAVRPDGSFVTPQNPARGGEIIRIYATGLGQTLPPIGTNMLGIATGDQSLVNLNDIVVGLQHAGVRLASARYAQNLIGVFELALEVPRENPPIGDEVVLAVCVVQGERRDCAASALPVAR